MRAFDIVEYLYDFEKINHLKIEPLNGFQMNVRPDEGTKINSAIREILVNDKKLYLTASKIRRSRDELLDIQAFLESTGAGGDLSKRASHQFEVRDKLRIVIFEDDKCIWNHTTWKKCDSKDFQCYICSINSNPSKHHKHMPSLDQRACDLRKPNEK